MEMNIYDNMSNSELKLKMKKLEDEYESIKIKINSLVDRMSELDIEYNNVNKIYQKRTKGFNI